MSLLRHTLVALTAPRRLVPILLVCAPLLTAQHSLSRDPLALPLALVMCVVFVLFAPYLWRRLARDGTWAGISLYGAAGVVIVIVLGMLVPNAMRMGETLMTGRESGLVSLALFLVGGWGLGRDIELEVGLQRERDRAEAMAREAERAQLLALRGQLDPHFLFNTLNAIAEWCRTDGEVAERAVLALSGMLRTMLAGVPLAAWPLQRELELCRDFFDLHLIRDPQLFTLELQGDPADVHVPPLLLLPLVENAVKHGPAAGHRGRIRLAVALTASEARIEIDNPGVYRGPRDGGQGMAMVERRLALAYDGRARLEARNEEDRTRVVLTIPRELPRLHT